MIRKFPGIPGFRFVGSAALLLMILTGIATVHAQQTQPQQPSPTQPQTQPQPDNQQSSSSQQEESPEELGSRKKKPKDYKNWTFNVGGGANATSGTTRTYVRSGGPTVTAGVARNANKYLGLRLDFQFNDLPLRTSALQLAQAPGSNSRVYSLNLDPIVNVPVTKLWGGYFFGGPSFLHRSGKLDSSTAVPGDLCNGFFLWWGPCRAGSLPLFSDFLHSSQNEFGANFGGGITRKIHSDIEFYAEFRYLHGSRNGITTDTRPITIGIRW